MSRTQEQLNAAYGAQLPKLGRAIGTFAKSRVFSCPHLVDADAFPYATAPLKVMIVGQQTLGWCRRWDGRVVRGLVEELLANYREFALGEGYYNSPFWAAARKVCKGVNTGGPENAFIWSNLLKVAEKHACPRADVIDQALLPHFNMVPVEVSILGPDAVVFFTGPNYDDVLTRAFPGARLVPAGRGPVREFARVEHRGLPKASFRTYHPGYLRRAGKWKMLDRLIERIKDPLR